MHVNLKRIFLAISVIACLGIFIGFKKYSPEETASFSPVQLECEYRIHPLGIDTLSPNLSWKLTPANASTRGLVQTAYQVLAASCWGILWNGFITTLQEYRWMKQSQGSKAWSFAPMY